MLIVVRVVVLRVRDSVRDDDVLNARVLKLCALAMLLFCACVSSLVCPILP